MQLAKGITWEMGVVSSLSKLLRLIFSFWSFSSSGTLYTTAPIPLKVEKNFIKNNISMRKQQTGYIVNM